MAERVDIQLCRRRSKFYEKRQSQIKTKSEKCEAESFWAFNGKTRKTGSEDWPEKERTYEAADDEKVKWFVSTVKSWFLR